MRFVVDASVAAKWLAPEPDSAAAVALLAEDLIVPDLVFAEVANILWKKAQRGEMASATAQVAMEWLVQYPWDVHEGAGLASAALAVARQLGHPAYDCFYLALAERAQVPLVTADHRLHARCQAPDAAHWAHRVRLLVSR